MLTALRRDAEIIARGAVDAMHPGTAVANALESMEFSGEIYLVAVGKAAWSMADAALKHLPRPIRSGIVLTKYGHVPGPLPGVMCLEAGHPVPDDNSYRGTQAILQMVRNLSSTDTVLFLLSGGGSALFELPLCDPGKLAEVNSRLLASGADIRQINTVRKRLSAVKGGRFALACGEARIRALILSDVLGDPIDIIASGPAAPDSTTSAQALAIAKEYGLHDPEILELLARETPKELPRVESRIIGSVSQMCRAAEALAREQGYAPILLTDRMAGIASEEGRNLAQLLQKNRRDHRKIALIAGGETVVRVRGNGLGGRNQELALSAAELLAEIPDACIISLGSDGTDGPTDAAGGYADSHTLRELAQAGVDYKFTLENNDSYHALEAVDALIFTGPTLTNVNDITIGLLG